MNWLAHLYLSEPRLDARLGNLLADVVRGEQRLGMSEAFLRGVRCHVAIDAFTDHHPVVRRSRQRLHASQRRFSAVLVDVFYDHLLARDWESYATPPLHEFNETLRGEIRSAPPVLPDAARVIVQRMIVERRFLAYREVAGIRVALERIAQRIEQRFGRQVALADAVDELIAQRNEFGADFAEFFPELQRFVAQWIRAAGNA